MKNMKTFFLLLLSFVFFNRLSAQDIDYQQIGDNLASTIVDLQPGELVYIYGDEQSLRMMEAVAIGVEKLGGSSVIQVMPDRVRLARYTEVPDEFFYSAPDPTDQWLKDIDVLVVISSRSPNEEKIRTLQEELPEEKMQKFQKWSQHSEEAMMKAKTRLVIFNHPSEEGAKIAGIDPKVYTTEWLNGLTADFSKVQETGKRLEEMLVQSKEVHITTPAGTDITFKTSGRKCLVMDGSTTAKDKEKPLWERVESVPGGILWQSVHEHSANGKLVIPKMRCNDLPKVNNLSVTFTDGMMGTPIGVGNDCVEEALNRFEKDARLLGEFSIGLNPRMQVIEKGDANFRPSLAAGMVFLYLGNNEELGGENTVMGGYSFPLTHATVTIDGVTVVKDGMLLEPE